MNTAVNPSVEFPKVEKMLYNLAWKFHAQYPLLAFEEAKSQAYWGFMEACRMYKEGHKTKFLTFCYQIVWYKLKDLVMSGSSDRLVLSEMDDDLCGEVAPAVSNVRDLIADLPQDAHTIVEMLLETPAELIGLSMTPKQFLTKVKAYLVEHRGHTYEQVDAACALLRARFQEAH